MEKKSAHRVLIISNKPPYPVVDGGCYAMSKFEQLLHNQVADLNYFAISTQKHPFDEKELPGYWKLHQNFFTGKIDTTVKTKHVAQFLSGKSLRAKRFYTHEVLQSILKIIREKNIDLVIFESVYSAVYLDEIKKLGHVKTILRSHNIEHLIWQKYASGLKGLKKRVMDSETTRLRNFEEHVFNAVNGVVFISENDAAYHHSNGGTIHSIVIPVQMHPQSREYKIDPVHLKLFHIGAMDWLPNVEGIENFIQHIFPELVKKFPGIELHLAGKSMPASFDQYNSAHIKIHGQVKDAGEFMDKYDVLIVPIHSGGGIRIKILEAMAQGKPVISTQMGIEGINAQPKHEFLLADTMDQWIEAVEFVKEQTNYTSISTHGCEFIDHHYSERILKEKLINFITEGIH